AKGGGVVLIPKGEWLSGPAELKSNVNLHLESNARLAFTDDLNEYKLIETNWQGQAAVRIQHAISATGLENIAITGNGIIDGSGDAWRPVKKSKLTDAQWKKLAASGGALSDNKEVWYPTEKALKGSKTPDASAPGKPMQAYEEIKDFLRPNLLVLSQCKNVLLEGVTFQNSPAWCLHPLMSEHITIRNINVRN